jgi:phospholipid/cholesterol/gamma-HCH transport system permease protein
MGSPVVCHIFAASDPCAPSSRPPPLPLRWKPFSFLVSLPAMAENAPHLTRHTTPAHPPCQQLLGSWTAARLAEPAVWRALQTELGAAAADAAHTTWDLRAVQRLDHTGAQVLWNAWGHQWPTEVRLLAAQRSMLERVARYTVPAPPASRHSLRQLFLLLGAKLWFLMIHVRDMVRLIGQLLLDGLKLARAPHKGPWRDVSGHLYHIGATALPITALVGFLIGVVLAYLISQQLRQFGADAFIVNILGLSLIRELGPVLAAILIAGRSGSAITAQIGVMRVTEELDAMRVMGIAQGYRLVLPRAIAMALAMPLITVWTTLAALLGGMLAADLTMGVTPSYFFHALPLAVKISNLVLAVGKSAVFGLLIALIGCHYGLRIEPNTESLGRGTTASVVTAITMVILVDALFAIVFKDIGL